ncbi:hypothetical protein FRB97_003669 [Tulasnella sp. 331]|nr:hypothetical protein FRB97_003669 [Tulasnella sp. 331]
MDVVEGVKGNVEDAKALVIYIATVTNTTMNPFKTKPTDSLDKSPETKKRLEEFKQLLTNIQDDMKALMDRKLRRRVFSYARDATKLAEMKKKVDDAINRLQLETVVATGHEIELMSHGQGQIAEQQQLMMQEQHLMLQKQEASPSYITRDADRVMQQQQYLIIQKQEIEHLIGLLGNGDSGAGKKDPCLKGARVTLLHRIMQWAADPSGANKHCLCLLGMAGSGKSAIAATVADRAKESQQLGARFHFTRDEQERNKSAILVLARQLAYWRDRCLRVEIASALEEERDMAQMTLEVQYKKLIQEPLESLEGTLSALVIVLDALDECDANYAKKLLGLVGKGLAKLSTGVKFFITSRAEPHLQFYFNSEPMKSRRDVYTLGDEKVTELVNGDVEVYFKQKLPELVGPLLAEPSPDWPGEEKRRALVMKAQGLFLWATTATRIIADSNTDRDPEKQLELLLSSTHEDHLDGLYGQIFEHACPATINNDTLSLFRKVLGALVVARAPINVSPSAPFYPPTIQSARSSRKTSIAMY